VRHGTESRVNNSLGDPTTITDSLGRQTTIAYNKRREVVSQTSPGTATSGWRGKK
jgi:YD repeat-containing protein